MPSGSEKVLFLCTHGIGDLIMTIPTIGIVVENGFQIGLLVKGSAEKEVAEALLSDYEFSCATLAEFGVSL